MGGRFGGGGCCDMRRSDDLLRARRRLVEDEAGGRETAEGGGGAAAMTDDVPIRTRNGVFSRCCAACWSRSHGSGCVWRSLVRRFSKGRAEVWQRAFPGRVRSRRPSVVSSVEVFVFTGGLYQEQRKRHVQWAGRERCRNSRPEVPPYPSLRGTKSKSQLEKNPPTTEHITMPVPRRVSASSGPSCRRYVRD